MGGLRLYLRYVGVSLRGQMQYPGAVVLGVLGQFASTGIDFVAVWTLFGRFKQIEGWTFPEAALFYGVVSVAFALADGLTRGFDVFGENYVRTGDFDRLLLRPRSTVLQLMGVELRLMRLGRLSQGVLAWIVGVSLLQPAWGPAEWGVLAFAVAGGVALFCGILMLQATLAFWTVESLEIANTVTYGGVQAAQFPLDIYARWFRAFLTFVVPLGCVAYFPVAAVLGRADRTGLAGPLAIMTPLAGFLFLGLSLLAWRFGVRRYASTGS